MKKVFICVVFIALLFTGCGKDSGSLNVYNWGDYIDETIISEFEEKTGIKVNYQMYGSNEDLYVKIKSSGESYDVVFPSDYMVSKMKNEGLLYEYDLNELENYKNIRPEFRNLEFDPENHFAVPYFWGTMGIVYNKNMVDENDVKSLGCLFDKKYKDKILMYDAKRDVLSVGFKKLGYSLNSKNKNEIKKVKELMTEQKKNVLAYVTDNMKALMLAEEAAIGFTDSGDAIQIISEGGEDKYGYYIPKEGANIWIDAMVIPKNAKHKEMAKKFINFMLEKSVAQKNHDYVTYASPNKDMLNPLRETNPKLWEKFIPSKEDLKRCEVYIDLGDLTRAYDEAFTYIKSK